MRVTVVGTGYVGLVTAVGLAELGHTVTCADIDERKVDALNRGEPAIFEPGLEPLLRRNLPARLRATTDLAAAVQSSELTFVCVGTPSRPDGSIDVSFVQHAVEQIGAALSSTTEFHAVVVKSTVVPGTSDRVVRPALERTSGKRAGVDFGVGVNPEFLTEGTAVEDFLQPDRIVVGGDQRTVAALRDLYAGFGSAPIVETTRRHSRDDQVRLQRHAGHRDLVLQRDRQPGIRHRRHRRRRGHARSAPVALPHHPAGARARRSLRRSAPSTRRAAAMAAAACRRTWPRWRPGAERSARRCRCWKR